MIYYLATSILNRHDYFPEIRKEIDTIDDMKLSMDWPLAVDGFLEQEYINAGAELAARYAMRDTEIAAIAGSELIIILLPGGPGTFWEYGFAYGLGKAIIVYSPMQDFILGEKGHFVGMKGTVVVTGGSDNLIEAIKNMKSLKFKEMMKR
tara:strand:+ start:1817 stop:2266 length:450 start_codon:yes stop_codon:yes gene_type:complete